MSPEQANGTQLDSRSDIYSICCVMYQSLTGTLPFVGDNPLEILYKHVHETAPDLVTTQGNPLKLARAIHQGMQKDPADRFQSVLELADEIEEALKDRSLVGVRTVKSKRRQKGKPKKVRTRSGVY
jgi:serine/threonine-protein kinase